MNEKEGKTKGKRIILGEIYKGKRVWEVKGREVGGNFWEFGIRPDLADLTKFNRFLLIFRQMKEPKIEEIVTAVSLLNPFWPMKRPVPWLKISLSEGKRSK